MLEQEASRAALAFHLAVSVAVLALVARAVPPPLVSAFPAALDLPEVALDPQVADVAYPEFFPGQASLVDGSLWLVQDITDTAMTMVSDSLASLCLADMATVLSEATGVASLAMATAMVTLPTDFPGVLKVLEALEWFHLLLVPLALEFLHLHLLVLSVAEVQVQALVEPLEPDLGELSVLEALANNHPSSTNIAISGHSTRAK